jgi:hypothetical protein
MPNSWYESAMNTSAAGLRTDRQHKARFTTAEFLRMGESGAFDDTAATP